MKCRAFLGGQKVMTEISKEIYCCDSPNYLHTNAFYKAFEMPPRLFAFDVFVRE